MKPGEKCGLEIGRSPPVEETVKNAGTGTEVNDLGENRGETRPLIL
jgi:hypothetical protein